jgi:hypothetical protein
MLSGASGGRDNEDFWDKENRGLKLYADVKFITDQLPCVERKIIFFLDATGYLCIIGTYYDVRHLKNVASLRNYVFSRKPPNLDVNSFCNILNEELERWTECMNEVIRLQAKSFRLNACLKHLSHLEPR